MAKTLTRNLLVVIFSACFLSMSAATFTSIAPGLFNAASTWTFTGVDANGIPDSDDDVIINHTVTLDASSNARNITINAAGTLNTSSYVMLNWGSLTNNGTISGTGSWQFRSTGTYSGNTLNSQGSVYFYANYTIAANVNVTKTNGALIVVQGVTVTNNGTFILNNVTNGYLQFNAANSTWINAANSTLSVGAGILGTGVLTATATGNTVNYRQNGATSVRATTYYNLAFNGATAHTKALAGNVIVRNNVTIGSTVTLNCANFNITIGGSWLNNSTATPTNQNTITFNGTGTQTITRGPGTTETFNNVTIAGTGTVLLQDTLRANGHLTISSGTLDVSTGNMAIRCVRDFINNSIFNGRQGTVFMVGTVAQVIGGTSTTSFYNLTSSNTAGVTVNLAKQITNILTVSAGSFGPSASGFVLLPATGPTTYGKIARLGSGASLIGTGWSIQTYIDGPATAYWQYLGPPVQSTTLQDWDSDPRFYMSGVGGNDGNACCPVFYSVRTYNTSTNTYTNITSVNTVLNPARGYMVWMADNINALTAPLIFDTRGTPNFNNVSRAVTAGGAGAGYNLVSNPYACPVQFSSVVSASSATLSPNFLILQENGSYATNPNSGRIAPVQGFMCIASTSGNIVFTEACKTTASSPNVIREMAGNEIRIKAGNQVSGLGEETTIKLVAGTDESMDLSYDLPYLVSPYDNATHIWTENSVGEQFLYDVRGTESEHLMVPLNVTASTPGIQMLSFKDLNTVTEYNCAWLEDLATGKKINLNATDTYEFEAAMGATRNFTLHLERTANCEFDLQTATASLDAQTNVFTNGEHIFAQFEFDTEEIVTVSMFDLTGRMVMGEKTMNVARQTVALDDPGAHGVYLVRIQKGNEVSTKKIYY